MVSNSDAPSAGADAQTKANAASKAQVKKFVPRATGRKLPWLDGKGARVVPAATLESGTDTPSPSTRPSSRKASALKSSKSSGAPTPTVRKASLAVPTKLRAPSAANSSPSPATRHRLSQIRRASVAHKYPSPLITPASHRPSVSHAPQKRLSIVSHHDEEPEEDDFGDVRPRIDSLAPVPGHLEWSDTSDSMFKRDVVSSTSPEVVSRVQFSPSQPAPTRTAFERVGDRGLSNAIEDLEEMVQEAVEMADETEDRGQVTDIYEIIEDAKASIQEALADPMKHPMAPVSPLATSGSSGERGIIRLEISRMENDQQRPASVDWAYQRHGKRSETSSSSLSSSDRGRSRFSTQSDLLLPPQPVQIAPRDHVDFVLRPIARDQSRGRPRRRHRGDHSARDHRHRHRHNSGSGSWSRSGRRQHLPSDLSQYDTSFDEEEPPAHAYGTELTVRKQAHHHTFNLHRHHRRQPIARNWTTVKKRLTAVIACVNTALLGIIVGIYVSPSSQQRFIALTLIGGRSTSNSVLPSRRKSPHYHG